MNDEGTIRRRRSERAAHVALESEGMRPAIIANHTDRKVAVENLFLKGIVVANGGHPANQVLHAAPPEAHALGNCQVLAKRRTIRMINVPRPRPEIGVRPMAEPWKEIEFQMVVSIDKSGENQVPRQING